nr:hypothetical protein [Endozoicomonas sp.]
MDLTLQPITTMEKAVLKDETCLKNHICKYKARYIDDGLLRSGLKLPDDVRDPLLPPLGLLHLEHRCSVGRITYAGSNEKYAESIDRIMKVVLNQQKNIGELSVDLTEGRKKNPDSIKEKIPKIIYQKQSSGGLSDQTGYRCKTQEGLNVGSYLGIYNPYNPTNKKVSIEIQENFFNELTCGEGLVLKLRERDNGSHYWKKVASYQHAVKHVQVNPLLQEVLDSDRKSRSNGEYYLPVKAIKELSEIKRKSKISPSIYYCGRVSDEKSLKAFKKEMADNVKNTDEVKISLMIMHFSALHMTAVRVILVDGKIIVYLHEAIRPECSGAREIRDFVINGVMSVVGSRFNREDFCFFTTPVFEYLQEDYRSCTVTALKILMAFDNPDNNLDQFFMAIFNGSHSDSSKVDYNAFVDENDRETGVKKRSVFSGVKIGSIPLVVLPAVLLKLYQGDQKKLSNTQKETIVSHRKDLTLQQYYTNHHYKNGGQTINLASIGKTYKYFVLWKDMLRKYETIFRKFSSVDFGGLTKEGVNQWLKKSAYEYIEINHNDWELLKQYKAFMTMEANLNEWPVESVECWAKDSRVLQSWLKEIVFSPESDQVKQFLRAWCQYINDNLDQNSEVGDLWFRKKVSFFIERLDSRLNSLRISSWSSEYPFHLGEAECRKSGDDVSDLECQRNFNNVIESCSVRTEIKAPQGNSHLNRIVMTFKRRNVESGFEWTTMNNVCSDDSGLTEEACQNDGLSSMASISASDTSAVIDEIEHSLRLTPTASLGKETFSDHSFDQAEEMITQETSFIAGEPVSVSPSGQPVITDYIQRLERLEESELNRQEETMEPELEMLFDKALAGAVSTNSGNTETPRKMPDSDSSDAVLAHQGVAKNEPSTINVNSAALAYMNTQSEYYQKNCPKKYSRLQAKHKLLKHAACSSAEDAQDSKKMADFPLALVVNEPPFFLNPFSRIGERDSYLGSRRKNNDFPFYAAHKRVGDGIPEDKESASSSLDFSDEPCKSRLGVKRVKLTGGLDRKAIKRKEDSRISAKKTRDEKKRGLESLRIEASEFFGADSVEEMKNQALQDAKQKITTKFIEWVCRSTYLNDEVFEKYSVSYVAELIAQRYALNETGSSGITVIKDFYLKHSDLKYFVRKVKGCIDTRVRRDAEALFVNRLKS